MLSSFRRKLVQFFREMATRFDFPADNYDASPQFLRGSSQKGLTLIELLMAVSILLVLSTAAIPIFRNTIIRQRESELRRDLREMRKAIDRYKDMADRNLIGSEFGSQGYPKDLDTLVKGVPGSTPDAPRTRFLRRIPVDPTTGKADWDMQAIDDDPDSPSFGGHGVFDVHSKSQAVALDGTSYSKW